MCRPRSLLTIPVLLAAMTLATSGCGDNATTDTSSSTSVDGRTATTGATGDLAGTSWMLASYGTQTGPVNATPSSAPLTFGTNGALAGSTGCNRFSGTYLPSGDRGLTITLGPMTQMACTDPALTAQEAAIVAGLPAVRGFERTPEQLTLTADDGAVLFTYAIAPTGLTGTSWTATGVNNGKGAVESTALTEKLTLAFDDTGTVSAFGGCNQLSGSYTADEQAGTVTISALAGTMMACEPDVMALETQYTAALGNVSTYQIEGDMLTLRDAAGAMQATFVRAS